MRYSREGFRVATTIFEAAAFQYPIKASCQTPACGHWAVFQPHALWWLFFKKRWRDDLPTAVRRFRCTACNIRDARLELTHEPVTITHLPMPDEGEWKRQVNRFRC